MKSYETEDVKAVAITYRYGDWNGSCEAWREAYFQMLSWKNTWYIPFEMDIHSNSKHEAFLYVLVPEKKAEQTREFMDAQGYKSDKQGIHEETVRKIIIDYDYDDDCVIHYVEY